MLSFREPARPFATFFYFRTSLMLIFDKTDSMNLFTSSFKTNCLLTLFLVFFFNSHAHNGKIAHAYPLGKIMVDGNLSDWPQLSTKYDIATFLSGAKPAGTSDFSGFFQVGYRIDNRSLYIAFTINDDDFIEDTSANVRSRSLDSLAMASS